MQQNDCGFAGDLANSIGDGLRWIRRRGENFQEADTSTLDPDAVGEGAAGIDGDAEGRRLRAGSDRGGRVASAAGIFPVKEFGRRLGMAVGPFMMMKSESPP
jgi:hypothetical protein